MKRPRLKKNYGADMAQVINEMLVELLATDEADMQAVYDEYMEEWESIGGSTWETEITELYNSMNK